MKHFLRADRLSEYLAVAILLGSVAGCGASSVEEKSEAPVAAPVNIVSGDISSD
jgi:endoglucanase